jgi:hypothetical protein
MLSIPSTSSSAVSVKKAIQISGESRNSSMAETDKNDRPIVGIGRGIRHQEQHYPPFEKAERSENYTVI